MKQVSQSLAVLSSTTILLWTQHSVAQNCTICQDDQVILDPDQPLNKGGTCGEVDALVKTISVEQCTESETDIIVAGIRCGCRDEDQFPVCGVRQNPSLCTTGLLEAATETCECYTFCGKDFYGCENYPGDRLTSNNCDKSPVSGCTPSVAFDGPNPFILCPGICPNGASMKYPNRTIPTITLIENFFLPTCQQADEYLKDSDGLDCDFVQSLAGYCGCEGIEKRNSCSFCPENQESQNLDFKTDSFFTCRDAVEYVEYLSPLDCNRTSDLSGKLDLAELQEICQCAPIPTAAPSPVPTNEPIDADALSGCSFPSAQNISVMSLLLL
eukprot:scaffold24994_cov127-Cylindrotheca_fusiformis.AAC.2